MTTLVTGATGLLGNNIVRVLLESGHSVRVMVRENSDPRPLEGLDVEITRGDLRDQQAVQKACQGVEAVIHSAALVHIGWGQMEASQAINVEGTRIIGRAAREAGARLVHVSSVDAVGFGTPDHPADEETPLAPSVPCSYVVTKRAAEEEVFDLVEAGLDAVIVNPGYMLGPWDWKPSSGRMLLAVAGGWALLAPQGRNNFCGAVDVARGTVAALQRGRTGARYILGGETLSYLEAWQIFAEVSGARSPWGESPGRLMMALSGRCGDLWHRLSGREPDVNSAAIAMLDLPRYYSHARAQQELDYQPRSVREAAEEAWNWFCEYGYAKQRK